MLTFFGAESYIPMAVNAGLIEKTKAENWLGNYREVSAKSRAFSSCNFLAYVLKVK